MESSFLAGGLQGLCGRGGWRLPGARDPTPRADPQGVKRWHRFPRRSILSRYISRDFSLLIHATVRWDFPPKIRLDLFLFLATKVLGSSVWGGGGSRIEKRNAQSRNHLKFHGPHLCALGLLLTSVPEIPLRLFPREEKLRTDGEVWGWPFCNLLFLLVCPAFLGTCHCPDLKTLKKTQQGQLPEGEAGGLWAPGGGPGPSAVGGCRDRLPLVL